MSLYEIVDVKVRVIFELDRTYEDKFSEPLTEYKQVEISPKYEVTSPKFPAVIQCHNKFLLLKSPTEVERLNEFGGIPDFYVETSGVTYFVKRFNQLKTKDYEIVP